METKDFPGSPTVLIDGSALKDFSRQTVEGLGASGLVDVQGQSFAKAIRLDSLQRIEPEWRSQVITPPAQAAVRKGDTLLAVCFARCLDIPSRNPATRWRLRASSLTAHK